MLRKRPDRHYEVQAAPAEARRQSPPWPEVPRNVPGLCERTSASRQTPRRSKEPASRVRISATQQSRARKSSPASTNPPVLPPDLLAAPFGCPVWTDRKMLRMPQARERPQSHQVLLARFSFTPALHRKGRRRPATYPYGGLCAPGALATGRKAHSTCGLSSLALPGRRELGGIAVQRNGVRNGASEREPAERLRP